MSLLKVLLLAAFIAHGAALHSNYSHHFRPSEDGLVIIDPSKPIVEHGAEFYWLGHYEPTFGLPSVCTIKSNSHEWIFGSVLDSNGTQIEGLQFGCPDWSRCMGTRCEPINVAIIVMIVLTATIVVACAVLSFILTKYPMWVNARLYLVNPSRKAETFAYSPRDMWLCDDYV